MNITRELVDMISITATTLGWDIFQGLEEIIEKTAGDKLLSLATGCTLPTCSVNNGVVGLIENQTKHPRYSRD